MTDAPRTPVLEVLQPGLLTTVQDTGRPDAMALGVPRSGACDPLALAAANLLAGNDRGAAALEVNLLGPELRVLRRCVLGLAGADCDVRVQPSGDRFEPGTAIEVDSGTRIAFGAAAVGVRAYLAIGGGFDVPSVLGSASTTLQARLGGLDGRALRSGDLLHAGVAPSRPDGSPRRWPGPGPSSGVVGDEPVVIRLLPGPHASIHGGRDWRSLLDTRWEVDPRSDRVGVRLRGGDVSQLQGPDGATSDGAGIISMPMVWGAVELPPGGSPICLLADHPTVGGYPVIGVVPSVDLPLLGQLAAATTVSFHAITHADAVAAAEHAAADLDLAEARLRNRPVADGIPSTDG